MLDLLCMFKKPDYSDSFNSTSLSPFHAAARLGDDKLESSFAEIVLVDTKLNVSDKES